MTENKVLIWNAHWRAAGGGEKYAFLLGAALAQQGYDVTLACTSANHLRYAKKFLNISDFNYREAVISQEEELIEISSSYDLFINTSFGSSMLAPIQNSIYLCHFPHYNRKYRILEKIFGTLNQSAAHRLSGSILNPQFRDYLWAEENMYIKCLDKESISVTCVQGSITITTNDFTKILNQNEKHVLSNSQVTRIFVDQILSSSFIVEGLRKVNVNRIFLSRLIPQLFPIETYKRVWANSEFTLKWIQEYWNIHSSVIYPPVEMKKYEEKNKNKYMITSIGRFMSPDRNHSKNQHLLVKAFKKVHQRNRKFTLDLFGGLSDSQQKYFDKVYKMSITSPIELIPNASQMEIDMSLSNSSFLWHGTGLKQSVKTPYKMEHFGLSVVEAMSAGVIPLVYNVGGPAEVLKNFPELIYGSIDELIEKTLKLSEMELSGLRGQLAIESRKYDMQSFIDRVIQNIE